MTAKSHLPPADPLRIVVADDHDVVRDSVVRLLTTASNMHVVAEAANHTELLEVLEREIVDVIVLDLGMPGRSPISIVSGIRIRYPSVKIVVYSAALDAVSEMLRLGVNGYVVKTDRFRYIADAIRAVMHGHVYLSPLVDEYVNRHEAERKHHGLTPQHIAVLRLLADGLNTKQIADELQIGSNTVQNHILAIRRRTGLRERSALASFFRRMFLDPSMMQET